MLVVEDNAADVAFFKEAISASRTPAATYVAGNGLDAMRFLERHQPTVAGNKGDLVIGHFAALAEVDVHRHAVPLEAREELGWPIPRRCRRTLGVKG